jgi:hypothetical protein
MLVVLISGVQINENPYLFRYLCISHSRRKFQYVNSPNRFPSYHGAISVGIQGAVPLILKMRMTLTIKHNSPGIC